MGQTGQLSPAAMTRTHEALKVCAAKLDRAKVRRSRLVATEACRIAKNSAEFLAEVHDSLGLDIEILTPEAEARLAVSGSAALIDPSCDYVLVFDIGGGSSELILLDLSRRNWRRERRTDRADAQNFMAAWTSLPIGVVTLAERFGGRHVGPDDFEGMVAETKRMLEPFEVEHQLAKRLAGQARAHARHLGHRDDDRRRASRSPALRPQPRRRLLAQSARRPRRHLRSPRPLLRAAHR